MDDLINNIERVHTTKLGVERIRRNVNDNGIDVVSWCRKKILDPKSVITKTGKNYYVEIDNFVITVNSYSYAIITVHRRR